MWWRMSLVEEVVLKALQFVAKFCTITADISKEQEDIHSLRNTERKPERPSKYEEVDFVMSKMFYRFTFRKIRFTILSKGNKYYGKWNSKMV